MVELVAQQPAQCDVVHFHADYLHFPVVRRKKNSRRYNGSTVGWILQI
jgi:hypothetical protein